MRRNLTIYILIATVMMYCTRLEALDWETDFKKASSTAKASGNTLCLTSVDQTGADGV